MDIKPKSAFQKSKAAQWLAILFGVLPIYTLAFLGGLEVMNSGEMEVPGVVGSLEMVAFETIVFGGLIVLLLIFFCGDSLASLQQKTGSIIKDSAFGITLGLTLLGVMILLGMVLNGLEFGETPKASLMIAEKLAENPLLLLVWLGPVIIIKAALLEEFTRVFLLTRMWKIWDRPEDKEACVVLASLLFGLGHIYQGAIGVIGTALIGYILGKAYMNRGRFWPLVLGHAIYDITVLLTLVTLVKSGGLDVAQ